MEADPLVVALAGALGYATQYWRAHGLSEGKLMLLAILAGAVATVFVVVLPEANGGGFEQFQVVGKAIVMTWVAVTLMFLGGVKGGSMASKTKARFTPPRTNADMVRKPRDNQR